MKKIIKTLAAVSFILAAASCGHQHTYGSWVYTDENVHTKTCTECEEGKEGHTVSEEHNWNGGVVVREATHTEFGLKTYTCYDCGGSKSEELPKLTEHTFDQMIPYDEYRVSLPTCTSPAVFYYTCLCGAIGTETFEYGKPNNHDCDYTGYCYTCCSDTSTEIDTSTTFMGSTECHKYFRFTAMAGSYKITYIANTQKLRVFKEDGTVVCEALDTEFTTEAGTYYINVYKDDVAGGPFTLVNTGHVHTYDYMGSCTVPGCDNSVLYTMTSWDSVRNPNYSNRYYCYTTEIPAGSYQFKYTGSKPTLDSICDSTGLILASDFLETFTIETDGTRIYILLHNGKYTPQSVYLEAVTE